MLKLSYSVIGTIALIWISAVSYYLYTTGDLFIVSIIVAVIVLVFQIVTKIKIANAFKQKIEASSKIFLGSKEREALL